MGIFEFLSYLIGGALVIAVLVLVFRRALRPQQSRRTRFVARMALVLTALLVLAVLAVFPGIPLFTARPYFMPSESMAPTLQLNDHFLVNRLIYRVSQPKREDVMIFKAPPMASPEEKDFIKRVVAIPGDVVRITPGYVIVGETSYSHRELGMQLASSNSSEGQPVVKLVNGGVMLNGRALSNSKVAAAMGEPNAKVKVVPGQVFLNGKLLKESFTAEDPDEPYPGGRGFVDPKWIVVDKQHQQEVRIPSGKLLVMGDNRNQSNDARYWGLLDRSRVKGKAMFIFWPPSRIRWVR